MRGDRFRGMTQNLVSGHRDDFSTRATQVDNFFVPNCDIFSVLSMRHRQNLFSDIPTNSKERESDELCTVHSVTRYGPQSVASGTG